MTISFEAVGRMSTSGNKTSGPTLGESVSVSVFKAKCLAIMEDVRERGVEYVVTKRGQPIAKVVPASDVTPDPFGFLGDTVLEEHDIVSPDHELWEESEA
jgi:prevent-host-death family protein